MSFSLATAQPINPRWHNPQPTTNKIFESFDDFVSGVDEEGFGMVMGGKERAATR